MKKLFFIASTLCSLIIGSVETNAQLKQLDETQYFKGNLSAIQTGLPTVVRWTDDSHFVLLRSGKSTVVDAKTGIETDFTGPKPAAEPAVFVRENDLFYKQNDSSLRLTFDSIREINPTMSPDKRLVAYTKNNDLYFLEINTRTEHRITHDGSSVILNGFTSWVYMEEIFGRSSQYRAFWWSPDSRNIAFYRFDDTKVPEFIITDGNGQHGLVEKTRYPKVGDPNPEVSVGIASVSGSKPIWADFIATDDQYFGMPFWKPDGQLLVPWMNRLQNQLEIYQVDPATGKKNKFYSETQKTWINLDDNNRINFLSETKGIILISDVSGWRHLYHYDNNGKLIQQISNGKFNVTDLNYIDEKNKQIFFTARGIENSARKDLYRVDFSGKNLKRLSFGDYNHAQINMSPQGSYAVTTYSNVSTPPAMSLIDRNGKIIKELASSKGPSFDQYSLARTELIRVKSDDGLFELPMTVTWPVNFDKTKKYPVLISIYGGPNAGRVMDTWQLNGSQQWYAKEGLIQVAMDHRGSGHFGKEGVNYMYHNLGYWEMKDYGRMVQWLIANGNADAKRICITGFSYGGYLSAYAVTYGSELFTHAMVGGLVADWSLYDSHYTERYMGTPANNPEGYKSSSVLTHTQKLKGQLQIVHGIIDDNVHVQNAIQLTSKLQDEKKDFEYMLYSGGRHGWGGTKGMHFQNLKTKFIYKHLLEKPVEPGMLK